MFVGLLLILAATAGAIIWRIHRDHTRDIDQWGRSYGMLRWPNEGNKEFHDRIRNRVMITGGRGWR